MFNPIICPVRNNLHLTRKAVASFQSQDIDGGVHIIVVNNASTDGTSQWLQMQRNVAQMYHDPPLAVSASWNRALDHVFGMGAEYALVVNNDVVLRPDTYRHLVEDGGGFVTAVGSRDPEKIKPNGMRVTIPPSMQDGDPCYNAPDSEMKRPHPDFSCYLIRRRVYEQVGPFDEAFLCAFGEDWDYHVRLHKAGITAYCIDLPFLHYGSMTIKNAEPAEIRRIQIQAEKNREYFKKKHGMAGASEEYYKFFGNTAPDAKSEF